MWYQIILSFTLFCNIVAEKNVKIESRLSPRVTLPYAMAKKRCQRMGAQLWNALTELHPKFPLFKPSSENDLFWIDGEKMHAAYKAQCPNVDSSGIRQCAALKFDPTGRLINCEKVNCSRKLRFICVPRNSVFESQINPKKS